MSFAAVQAKAETYSFLSIDENQITILNRDGSIRPRQGIKLYDSQANPTGSGVVTEIKGDKAIIKITQGKVVADGVAFPQPIDTLPAESVAKEKGDPFTEFGLDSTDTADSAPKAKAPPPAPKKFLQQNKIAKMKSREKLEAQKNNKSHYYPVGVMLGTHYSFASDYQALITNSGSAKDVTIKGSPALGVHFGYNKSNLKSGYQFLLLLDQSRSVNSISSDMPTITKPDSINVVSLEANWLWGEQYMGNNFEFRLGANATAIMIKNWQGTNSDLSGQYGGYGYQAGFGWNFAKDLSTAFQYKWTGGRNSQGTDSMSGLMLLFSWTWDRTDYEDNR
jgi:hypothetical protein